MNGRARVLVIDDDAVAQSVVARVLGGGGYEVYTLDSPIGATRAIREHGIDVVICDLHIPAMRADAFARMFRESAALRRLPLVVISAAPAQELDALLHEGTVDAVVHKSALSDTLLPLVRRLATTRRA